MLHTFGQEHGTVEMTHDIQYVKKLTGEGWVLLGVLESQEAMPRSEEVPPAPTDPNSPNSDYCRRCNCSINNPTYVRHFVETRFVFVLAQPKDEQIKALVEARDEAERVSREWEHQIDRQSIKIAELEEQIGEAKTALLKLADDLQASIEAVGAANTKAAEEAKKRKKAAAEAKKAQRLYRDHMAIIWQELGSARMRDLLGHAVESPIPLPKPKSAIERVAEVE